MNKKERPLRIAIAHLLKLQKDIATDSGEVLIVEGEVTIGEEVFVMTEDGEAVPAPDGSYKADGITYEVSCGHITSITDTKVEEEPNEEDTPMEEETPTEDVVEEEPKEEEPKEEEPKEETNDELEALKAENEALKAKIAELEAALDAFKEKEETALGKPIVEKDSESKRSESKNENNQLAERLKRVSKY